MAGNTITIGVASRPYPSEIVNGDAHAVHWSEGSCRIAVIDGLGHGVAAAEASARAVAVLDAHPDLDPAEALRRCHTALVGTRGAAISVVRLDPARGELVYAGIGNVEGHLWQGGRQERMIAYRGIIGSAMRTVRPFTMQLADEWTLLMHSDGVSARADLHALDLPTPWDPEQLAQAVLERYGREHDDALAVVAMPRA
ncbi:MAG TPA: SpoIIE family protein phosphatase [Chloroflexota bacterium]|nr:SpoIIE family protein phosphatase [Chloroflexota bacterium]